MIKVLSGIVLVAFVAAVLTISIRKFALKHALLDLPNKRSSHVTPTPRGGGVAIAAAVVVGVMYGWWYGFVTQPEIWMLTLGSGIVAVAGGADDYRDVNPALRLLAHFAAAALLVSVSVFNGLAVSICAILGVMWLVNLFNFMDGIDGIAAAEALTVSIGGAGLLLWHENYGLSWLSMSVAAASAGFLLWNWPPAKIFMGDVGSGFLGFVFGGLVLLSHLAGAVHLVEWLILLGVFIVDATWTLGRRMLRGVRVYEAHRSHAYQHAAILINSHQAVTVVVIGINLLWLLPLALLATFRPEWRLWLLVIAWTPLLVLAWRLKSGAEAERLPP